MYVYDFSLGSLVSSPSLHLFWSCFFFFSCLDRKEEETWHQRWWGLFGRGSALLLMAQTCHYDSIFFSPSCSRVWLVNWPFQKKKKETKIISLFLPSSVVDPKLYSPWSKFSFIYIIKIYSFLLLSASELFFAFLRIIRHTQHHDLKNKARMNWPRLLSTINTNNKKIHDGLVDLSLRRFDI